MEKTCPSCHSCGMPLINVSDFALGDVNQQFCFHCTDSQGQLKPYDEVLRLVADYLVHSQGLAMPAAMGIAKEMMSKLPAWRNRHASH